MLPFPPKKFPRKDKKIQKLNKVLNKKVEEKIPPPTNKQKHSASDQEEYLPCSTPSRLFKLHLTSKPTLNTSIEENVN